VIEGWLICCFGLGLRHAFEEALVWAMASIRVTSENFSSFHGNHTEGIHKVFASPGISIRGSLVEIAIDRNPASRNDGNQ
jgi:hypothetical protein